jgi:hypothetical protein
MPGSRLRLDQVLDAHEIASLDHLELYVADDFHCCLNHFGYPVSSVSSRERQNRAGDVGKLLACPGADKHAVCGGIAEWVRLCSGEHVRLGGLRDEFVEGLANDCA